MLAHEDRPLVYMEDVGRHNAVDKIAGYMFKHGVSPQDKIFYTTGRLTSEMVIKTVRMGIPILISRSGFTAWGVELARKVGAPVDIIADAGHAAGMRMRDYGGFGDPRSPRNALLIETGQHWRASSVTVAKDVTARFLAVTGVRPAALVPGIAELRDYATLAGRAAAHRARRTPPLAEVSQR